MERGSRETVREKEIVIERERLVEKEWVLILCGQFYYSFSALFFDFLRSFTASLCTRRNFLLPCSFLGVCTRF